MTNQPALPHTVKRFLARALMRSRIALLPTHPFPPTRLAPPPA
ncbi:hypothetical protein RISK_004058 [Rhodopirellula islandica]|uniref:Uncharacterized protein n=1 Tax=Rhodopirellula islandica TaxID=595434 RepID=A0A0J1BAX7_RHOIS|nr:hypothetical protein RISK_004058 [Rhodopirellula islandica]